MANSGPGVWGIDLGQAGLKAIRLQKEGDNVVATAFDYVEHTKLLSQPDADREALIREALEKFLSRNSLKGDTVCISVPGQSGLVRFVKLPPVAENKIADIVKFEAKQQIPFALDEVVWDYQKIGAGMVVDGMAIDTEIGLFAMKRDIINREMAYYQDVGIDIHQIQMNSLALCNYAVFDQLGIVPPKPGEEAPDLVSGKCVAVLEIGTELTNLVITDGNKIILQRTINVAGNNFTKALTKDLKMTFAKAEHLKRNATKPLPKEGPDLKTILTSLRPVFNDLQNEVQRSLTYFANANRNAEIKKVVGLGNAFHLPGLQRFLAEKLQLEVLIPKAFEKVGGDSVVNEPAFKENILSFAVAYGLALQGLKLSKIQTNLLPPEIRVERLIKAKKPWVAVTAASLLLGLSTCGFNTYMQARPFMDAKVQDQVKAAAAVKSTVEAGKKAFADMVTKTGEEKRSVETIIAGQQERANWLELMAYLQDAIPRPDGSNIYAESAKEYYKGRLHPQTKQYVGLPDEFRKPRNLTGEKAFDIYTKQLAQGVEQGQIDANQASGIDDMVQVSIQSIDARYYDNLSTGFWAPVKKKLVDNLENSSFVRPQKHWTTPPDGKGWVVELRGYTFHWASSKFITDVVLENMAYVGIRNAQSKAAAIKAASDPNADSSATDGSATPGAAGGTPPDMGPVINRVSHFVLYRYDRSTNMSRNGFRIVDQAILGDLAKGGASGGGGPGGFVGKPGMSMGTGGVPSGDSGGGGGAAPAANPGAGAGRASWNSLLASKAYGGSGPSGEGGNMYMPGGMGLPGMGASEGADPGAAAAPATDTPPADGAAAEPVADEGNAVSTGEQIATGARKRTEFVILFVWKEPTPSDTLRGTMAAAAGADAAAAPTPPADGGMDPSASTTSLFSKQASPAKPRTMERALKERAKGLPVGPPPAPELDLPPPPKAPKPEAKEGEPAAGAEPKDGDAGAPKAPAGNAETGDAPMPPTAPSKPPMTPPAGGNATAPGAPKAPGSSAPPMPPMGKAPPMPGGTQPGVPPKGADGKDAPGKEDKGPKAPGATGAPKGAEGKKSADKPADGSGTAPAAPMTPGDQSPAGNGNNQPKNK